MSYFEPDEVHVQTCDMCGEDKLYFEHCSSDYCEECKVIVNNNIHYNLVSCCNVHDCGGRVRKYRICIDCATREVDDGPYDNL